MDSHIQPDYYKDSSPQEALDATKATIDHIASIDPKNRLIKPIITPRFAPSCTKECLTLLGKLANETGLPIQTHISENIAEIDLVAELFPQYSSYAAVYDACGLLTRETLLAHAIHLSEDELSLVKARGCSISHCPASNTSLGSGLCPVRDLLDAGIVVGLGTDVSGGYSPSILAAAREAGGVSRMRTAVMPKDLPQDEKDRMKLSVEETLYLATRGGAQCLGLDSEVGEFKVGKQWDAQFVDLGAPCAFDGTTEGNEGKGNVQVWEGTGWEERVNKWVFCGDDRNTKAVWVAGRLVSGHM
jgi:guanine deaminase